MIDKQTITDKDFISKLCSAIEKRIGRKMTSPRDFDYLSDELTKIGRRVSGSTLKRIWGYNRDTSDTYKPYKYTLISLVNVLGYKNIEDYNENYDGNEIQSAQYIGETITIVNVMPGSIVELSWTPDRVCSLICLEKGLFKVVHSENGRLFPGDVVKFQSLTQNAPLYFNEVFRPRTNEKFIYTAGQRTGVRYRIRGIVNSEEETVITQI